MKWKKALEFLPKSGKEVFMKIEGTRSIGRYSEHHDLFINESGDFFPADQIEWLDESEQDEGWVPVAERLPEKRIRVNACLDGDIVFIGHLDFNGQWVLEEWDLAKDGSGQSKVTHWQPLPKPPATKD